MYHYNDNNNKVNEAMASIFQIKPLLELSIHLDGNILFTNW